MNKIILTTILTALVLAVSGCVSSETSELSATEYCQQQGGFVVTGPSLGGPADFCMFEETYCNAADLQSGDCKKGEAFYVCDAVGSRSEGYYDRDTKALISFAQCGSAGPDRPVYIPNPAAVYCQEQSGTVEIREDPRSAGGQYGVCILANGTECDEWAFYRGGCESCLTYCAKQPHIMCVGHLTVAGEYPDCECGWVCDKA